jgi:hypothetical protein
MVEQDYQRVERLVRPGLGFGRFHTAGRTLAGYEVMMRKGQLPKIDGRDMRAQAILVAELFQLAAWSVGYPGHPRPAANFATQPSPQTC